MGKAARNRARRAQAVAWREPGRLGKRARLAAVVAVAVAIAGALVLASVLTTRDDSAPVVEEGGGITVVGAAESRALLDGVPQQGAALGNPDAPVTLVEYADFQCPFCAEWSRTAFPEIVEDYVRTGKVRIVFRGVSFIGLDSREALTFALAAGEQGSLWNAAHLLYENQGGENEGWVSDELLTAIGRAIPGLDVNRAFADQSGARVEDELAAAEAAAAGHGIPGTPAFAAGRTGGSLQLLALDSLGAEALRPALDALLTE